MKIRRFVAGALLALACLAGRSAGAAELNYSSSDGSCSGDYNAAPAPYAGGSDCGIASQGRDCGYDAGCGYESGCGSSGDDISYGCCNGSGDCGGGCGGLYAEFELMFMNYFRADGMRVGDDAPGDDVDSSYQAVPRLTLGYSFGSGLGVRARYWEFDQNFAAVEGGGSNLDVNAYTFDLEAYERFCWNDCWSLEVSGGARYLGFRETLTDVVNDDGVEGVTTNSFYGWGGVLGAEVRRELNCHTALFARARYSVLMDDKGRSSQQGGVLVQNEQLLSTVTAVAELTAGAEFSFRLSGSYVLFSRCGVEWQQWQNFASNFAEGAADPERFLAGASDVGFFGFFGSVGVRF